MGCRTMLGMDIHDKENPYNRVGRGNLVPNTMILPKLGIEYGISALVSVKRLTLKASGMLLKIC